jgi:hypothetical protein
MLHPEFTGVSRLNLCTFIFQIDTKTNANSILENLTLVIIYTLWNYFKTRQLSAIRMWKIQWQS